MASIEMLGGNEAVARRTEERAKALGESVFAAVRQEFKQLANPDGECLTDSELESVAQMRKNRVMDRYKKQRDKGKYNDLASDAVGLRALIRGEATAQKIMEWMSSDAADASLPVLVEVGQAEGEKLYMLHLPRGAFEETQHTISFYPIANVIEPGTIRNRRGEIPELDERFDLSSIGEVVRVEGYGGELWQSPYSRPNGSSRETPEKVKAA